MNLLSPYQRARILLFSASIACFCVFWWAGVLFRIPAHPGHEAVLLQQPMPAAAFLVVVMVLLLCVALGTAIAGMVRYDAGLVAASIGLWALSARGGSTRQAIFRGLTDSDSPALFRTFLVETALLGAMVGLCAWLLARLYHRGIIKDRESGISPEVEPSPSGDASALAVQTILTAVGVLLLARTPAKQQAVAAVALASCAAGALTETFFPISSRALCWLPPILVGAIGYAWAWSDPAGYMTANLKGTCAALANPLPLDYASAGPAGALVGYWMGRRWVRQRAAEADSSAAPAN